MLFCFVITLDVRLKPIRVFEHVKLWHKHPPLDPQVTSLAECRGVPPRIIGFIAIKVVDCEDVITLRVVGMAASHTLPTSFFLTLLRYFRPVCCVFASPPQCIHLKVSLFIGSDSTLLTPCVLIIHLNISRKSLNPSVCTSESRTSVEASPVSRISFHIISTSPSFLRSGLRFLK